jgi:hypothetical protein
MEPKDATVHAHNEIETAASPAQVWRLLCHAAAWPQWYSNCAWLRFPDNDGPDLKRHTRFVWKTFGARVRSKVLVFEPFREIGWDAFTTGLKAYHGWIIEPLADGGCRVITEETQRGPLVRVAAVSCASIRTGSKASPAPPSPILPHDPPISPGFHSQSLTANI